MKKVSKLLVIFAAAVAMVLMMGCQQPAGGSGGGGNTPPYTPGGDDDNPKTTGEFTSADVQRAIKGTTWSNTSGDSFEFTSETEGTFTPYDPPLSIRAAGGIGFTYTTTVTKRTEASEITIRIKVKDGGTITIGGENLDREFDINFDDDSEDVYSFTITTDSADFTFKTPADTPIENYVRGSTWALTNPTIKYMKENFFTGNGGWFVYKVEFAKDGNKGTTYYYYKDGSIKKASSETKWSLSEHKCVLEGEGIDGEHYEIETTGSFYVGLTEFRTYDKGTRRYMTWTKQ